MPKIMVKSLIGPCFFKSYPFIYALISSIHFTHLYSLPFIQSSTNPLTTKIFFHKQPMANRETCSKHNMIANLDKKLLNVDFHAIIDFLTGSSINYALLVNPDIIGPWIQKFWATAESSLQDEESFIQVVVAGRTIRITEATIREDLLFHDEEGIVCFDKQILWGTLRDIGYEGDLTKITFQKPLFSPHWKYLIHVLLHCLSPKSTAWDQFGQSIAFALVGISYQSTF